MARPTVDADGFPLLPQSASGNTIRLVSGQAPGNDTPIDESNGKVEPARVKFQRHATGDSNPAPAKPSSRRANSVSSALNMNNENSLLEPIRNLNIVPVKNKVGSRHADVIDEWDGSGFGRSMLHHSGPYDAAAPSRNDVKKVGQSRAPMKAFRDVSGGIDPAVGAINTAGSSKRPSDATYTENPFDDDNLAMSPLSPSEMDKAFLPALGAGAASSSNDASRRGPHKTHHKKHSSKYGQNMTSPRGEGLTGQYSTSLPASGGYFPSHGAGGASGEQNDWEVDERRRREREREHKHKALQAAWGIDEPEPFEEFGYSPRYEEPNYLDQQSSPAHNVTSGIPVQPVRSLSFKLGQDGKDMSGEDYLTTRGSNGEGTSPAATQAGAGGKAGLKRTRSLLQRLRSMRDSPNVPANAYDDPRSSSPHSPYSEDTLGIREAVPEDDESPRTGSSASTQPSVSGATTKRRNSFLNRRRPSKMGSSGNGAPASHSPAPVKLADEFRSDEATNDREEYLVTPGKEYSTSPPLVADARSAATPTKGILKNGAGYFPPSGPYGASNEYTSRVRNEGRDKALPPPPPPPGPVLPDWNLPVEEAYRPREDGFSQSNSGANVKRKTSMLKKMRDRITKQP